MLAGVLAGCGSRRCGGCCSCAATVQQAVHRLVDGAALAQHRARSRRVKTHRADVRDAVGVATPPDGEPELPVLGVTSINLVSPAGRPHYASACKGLVTNDTSDPCPPRSVRLVGTVLADAALSGRGSTRGAGTAGPSNHRHRPRPSASGSHSSGSSHIYVTPSTAVVYVGAAQAARRDAECRRR